MRSRRDLFSVLSLLRPNALKVVLAAVLIATNPLQPVAPVSSTSKKTAEKVYEYDATLLSRLLQDKERQEIGQMFNKSNFSAPDMSRYSDFERKKVPIYFETRGEADVIVKDGKYISAGPLQFNAKRGYMLDTLLKNSSVRQKFGKEIDAFGGIRAIRRGDEKALDGLKGLLRDPAFLEEYFSHADRQYSWWESEIYDRYGIDIHNRSEAVLGLLRTIINNRLNDVFLIAEFMLSKTDAAQLNALPDNKFVTKLDEALVATLNETLDGYRHKNAMLRNYRATIRFIKPYLGKEYKSISEQVDITANAIEQHLISISSGLAEQNVIKVFAQKAIADNKGLISLKNIPQTVEIIKDELANNLAAFRTVRKHVEKLPIPIAKETAALAIRDFGLELPDAIIKDDRSPRGLLAKAQRIRAQMQIQRT